MTYRLPLDSFSTEIVFAPFNDVEHSPWLPVHIDSEFGGEIVRDSLWDSTVFSWAGKDGSACFTLRAFSPFDTNNYDELVLCLSAPKSASLEVALLNVDGKIINRWAKPVHGKNSRQELVYRVSDLLPVSHLLRRQIGMSEFAGVALRVISGATNLPIISLIWFGLRNSKAYRLTRRLQHANRPDWAPWILPEDAWGEIRFERGLLFDTDALSSVREKLKNVKWSKHFTLLEEHAAEYMKRDPEADFGEYLPTHDLRYIRESQHGRTCYHWEALVLAFVGLVKEDRRMIRHALRYMMCMVHTRYWTESGEHNIPSSTWSHLCFQEEMTTTSVAILFDWLGFALFPRTHNLIRKALVEKGMAHVTRDLSTRDSIHRMNQGAVFNRALILGGLMLESKWAHFGTQTVDCAYASMCATLDNYIKPDGGVHEGIAYLCQTMNATLWAMIAYGRARGLNWEDDVRTRYQHVGRYVAVMSAMHPGKAIPAGDCRVEWFGGDALPIMAALCPDSPFSDILGNCLTSGYVHKLTGTLSKSGGLVGMVYGPNEIHESRCIVPPFDILPQAGKVTMTYGGKNVPQVRLWISGSAQGATHAHRDLGHFTLEADLEGVFIERGMVEYWHTEAHFLSRSWLHNVMTPLVDKGSYPNQLLPSTDDLISVSPNHTQVTIPGCNVWADWMMNYHRVFTIESPENLSVADEFNIITDGRIAFHLHSLKAFQIRGTRAILKMNNNNVIELSFPWAEAVECREVLNDLCNRPVFHICASSPVLTGDCRLESTITVRRA